MTIKRFFCIFFCLILTAGTIASAAIREPDTSPCYSHTDYINASLSISSGMAKASGYIKPKGSQKTSITVRLQQKVDGKWKTIATWTDSNASGSSEAGGNKGVTPGYSYRAYVTGRVYDSAGKLLETASKASSVKTC